MPGVTAPPPFQSRHILPTSSTLSMELFLQIYGKDLGFLPTAAAQRWYQPLAMQAHHAVPVHGVNGTGILPYWKST